MNKLFRAAVAGSSLLLSAALGHAQEKPAELKIAMTTFLTGPASVFGIPDDVVTHPPEAPLGGWKESGYGTEGGIEILEPYQKTKFVSARS